MVYQHRYVMTLVNVIVHTSNLRRKRRGIKPQEIKIMFFLTHPFMAAWVNTHGLPISNVLTLRLLSMGLFSFPLSLSGPAQTGGRAYQAPGLSAEPSRSLSFVGQCGLEGQGPRSLHWLAGAHPAQKPEPGCQQHPIFDSALGQGQIPGFNGAFSEHPAVTG